MPTRLSIALDSIGRRVAELRKERRWSQAVLAERMKLSAKYVQRIEAGRENLTVESLLRLADALGVDVVALFETPTMQRKVGRPPTR